MISKYKKEFANILNKYFPDLSLEQIIGMIEIVPDNVEGDLGFPCFQFAKLFKKSPNQIASEIVKKRESNVESNKNINLQQDFSLIAVGPYINFLISTSILSDLFFGKIFKEQNNFGKSDIGQGKTILIESPGPNTNKPLHLGHVRNMLLGNSLAEIMKFAGYNVKKVDIINDRGIHICKSMLAYQKFGQGKTPQSENKKSDHFVGDWYVEYANKVKIYPEMDEEIKQMLVKWEEGDKEVRELWAQMNKRAIDGMQQTYKRYGCYIDKAYYESEHYLSGKDIVLDGLKQGIFSKDDKGNIIFKYKNSKGKEIIKVVLRADGTSVYATQDIGLADKRFKDFNMDKMIYVVANEQEDHFKALFKIFNKLGYKFSEQCFHLSYGMISLPTGKMKSREGTVVDADNLADEMYEKSLKILSERENQDKKTSKKDFFSSEISSKAEKIAMGAIKFFILKYGVKKDFVFNPAESLSFEGETGPYLQYTFARCNSIISRYDSKITYEQRKTSKKDFFPQGYKDIVFYLSNFEQIVEESAEQYKPEIIVRYLYNLAQKFNLYYAKNKILTENKDQTIIQVSLVFGVKQVIENGLKLLGIETIQQM